MQEVVTQRVNEFREQKKLSVRSLSEVLGIGQTTLNKQLKDDGYGVSLSTIVLILEKYPDLSAEWLLRGTGTMTKDGTQVLQDRNEELVAALRDNIEALKESNALLREKVMALEAEKKGVRSHGHVAVAAEEGVR